MKLGRVIGTMVATVKPEGMKGLKLLVVRPLSADLNADGDPFVATDASAQASSGDLVTWEAAREAALLHDPWFIPVDHAIVGIVDQHDLSGAPAPTAARETPPEAASPKGAKQGAGKPAGKSARTKR